MLLLKHPLEPLKQRLFTALTAGVLISCVFFTCYPLANWFTSTRTDTWKLYFNSELSIPFIPHFIWLYLSLYLLLLMPIFLLNSLAIKQLAKQLIIATLIATAIFIIIPCHLGFDRVLPLQNYYQNIFTYLFSIDYPYNLVPSLHVIYATLIILTINQNSHTVLKLFFYCWLFGIICSTIFIHQHHLLDVISGLGLSLIIYQVKGIKYEKNHSCSTVTHT